MGRETGHRAQRRTSAGNASAGGAAETMSGVAPSGRVDVAVLDPEGPPGVAFIRSLGARGVAVDAYGVTRWAAGSCSKYVRTRRRCPSPHDTDDFIDWLTNELSVGRIAHVAPTSDYIAFAVAVARERAGQIGSAHTPTVERTWGCLHKGRFGELMEVAGFPTVPFRLPTSLVDAVAAAAELGYPVVLKPRSHNGIGFFRGAVVRDAAELATVFGPLGSLDGHHSAAALDPDLSWPMMQKFVAGTSTEVVSISGCLGADGKIGPVGCSRKLTQWPPNVGIGSLFEAVAAPDVLERALSAVAAVAPPGLFELEILVDRATGEAWPIDLNPRAFGQIALEIARGNDLPGAWFHLATGIRLEAPSAPAVLPELWQSGLTYFPGRLAALARGSNRSVVVREELAVRRRPRVGSVFAWSDPLPAVALTAHLLRHPKSLLRPFL